MPRTISTLQRASGARRHLLAGGASVVVLVVVTVAIGLLKSFVPVLSLGVLYVFAVLPIAVAFDLTYAVLVSIASMLAFNWFFLPPVHTFTLSDSRNWFALAVYLVVFQHVPVERSAQLIADGNVVGWFQGRMEWGARALGNRSILADPRRADMRELINTKIKFREKFRPFAPSILEDALDDYFVGAAPDPFMQQVYPVREDKRAILPAITHADGSGRLQTVSERTNPRYYRLISEFAKLTGVPVVLNTSFNENEPIVLTPAQALDCFLRTSMDVLVIGRHVLERVPA